MKKAAQNILHKLLRLARRHPGLAWMLEEDALQHLQLTPDMLDGKDWVAVDKFYTYTRERLARDPVWRYGPLRVAEVAHEAFNGLSLAVSVPGRAYVDLGCGCHHPFGTSTVMYLNGATETLALDITPFKPVRAAQALFDLLADALVAPARWNWAGLPLDEFRNRIFSFDLDALRDGRMDEGLRSLPLRHRLTNVTEPLPQNAKFDLMSSRAVLEHFPDFPAAARQMFNMLNPGGVATHHIDLVDHRVYTVAGTTSATSPYHFWSFLAEDETWSDGNTNRLRSAELRAEFEKAGFKIVNWRGDKLPLPDGFRARLKGRFAAMPDGELEITTVYCTVQKPA